MVATKPARRSDLRLAMPVRRSDFTSAKPARRSDFRSAMLFLIPAFIGFIAFFAWPTVRGVYLSFTEFNLLRAS